MKKGRTTKAKPEPAEAPVAEQTPAEPEASAQPDSAHASRDASAADYVEHAVLELGAIASGLDGIRAEEIEQLEIDQAEALALALEAALGRLRKFAARLKARV